MTKYIVSVVIALIVAGGVYGGYKYLVTPSVQPAGSVTNGSPIANTSKVAETTFNMLTGTSTSIQNTDAQDRIIISNEYFCSTIGTSQTAYTGAGLSALTLQAATTSSSYLTTPNQVVGNTNYTVNVTIGTSTTEGYIASSTSPAGNGADGRRWAAGTWMTWFTNATNTAQCIVDVKYLQGLGV